MDGLAALRVAGWAVLGFAGSLAGSMLVADALEQREELRLRRGAAHAMAGLVAREQAAISGRCEQLSELLAERAPSEVLSGDELSRALRSLLAADESTYTVSGDRVSPVVVRRESGLDAAHVAHAAEAPVAVGDAGLVLGCPLRFGSAQLVLLVRRDRAVLSSELDALLHALGGGLETDTELSRSRPLLTIARQEGGALSYGAAFQREGLADLTGRALAAAAGMALLLALVALRLERGARTREDEVLSTLEVAATRIGQGDLITTLSGRATHARAEQTFQRFDRMVDELREAREKLREAERAGAFRDVARQLAHELKNPLFPIRTSIETLRKTKERLPGEFDEAFEETTRVVLEEVQRLERIVREFGEFARLPAPVLGRIDTRALVEDVAALHGRERVSVRGSGPLYVRADRELVTQALINLVLNALDAGGEHAPVELWVEPDAEWVCLHVDDAGPGVPEADRARVFEPYFTTKREGSGLGLAIAQRIAREHGGRITIARSPLGGARFTLALPRVASEPHAHSASMP
jgi:two-component system, NtrC family, nitrogen regulation sensor histidine kinase NtrY